MNFLVTRPTRGRMPSAEVRPKPLEVAREVVRFLPGRENPSFPMWPSWGRLEKGRQERLIRLPQRERLNNGFPIGRGRTLERNGGRGGGDLPCSHTGTKRLSPPHLPRQALCRTRAVRRRANLRGSIAQTKIAQKSWNATFCVSSPVRYPHSLLAWSPAQVGGMTKVPKAWGLAAPACSTYLFSSSRVRSRMIFLAKSSFTSRCLGTGCEAPVLGLW